MIVFFPTDEYQYFQHNFTGCFFQVYDQKLNTPDSPTLSQIVFRLIILN